MPLLLAKDDPVTWPVVLAAVGVTVLCVMIHYEGLRLIIRRLRRRSYSPRLAIIATVLCLLILHFIEICLYAACHSVLHANFGARTGYLVGDYDNTLFDNIYFSAAVYTTVGFGDIVPEGPIRILVAVEALTGLVLITWSASFTFLIMQYHWTRTAKDEDGDDGPPPVPPRPRA